MSKEYKVTTNIRNERKHATETALYLTSTPQVIPSNQCIETKIAIDFADNL